MIKQILIPHHIWIDRKHKRNIRKLTNASIMPHDKPFVWSSCDDLQSDCRLIEQYIKARA